MSRIPSAHFSRVDHEGSNRLIDLSPQRPLASPPRPGRATCPLMQVKGATAHPAATAAPPVPPSPRRFTIVGTPSFI